MPEMPKNETQLRSSSQSPNVVRGVRRKGMGREEYARGREGRFPQKMPEMPSDETQLRSSWGSADVVQGVRWTGMGREAYPYGGQGSSAFLRGIPSEGLPSSASVANHTF